MECWGRIVDSPTFQLYDARAKQTVDFPTVTPDANGTTFTVTAAASSGLPVTFASETPGRCTVSGSSVASTEAPVTQFNQEYCVVRADQGGDARWQPAQRRSTFVPVTIRLGSLARVYDGNVQSVSHTVFPAGYGVAVTYDGQPTPPSAPGRYAVVARSTMTPDFLYIGRATGTLVIEMPRLAVLPARVSLSASAQVTVYVYSARPS